jgi:hypothetical protein
VAIKHRIRKWEGTKLVEMTARRAIQLHCQECMGFNANLVRGCTDKQCALYPFRTKDNPQKWSEGGNIAPKLNENRKTLGRMKKQYVESLEYRKFSCENKEF